MLPAVIITFFSIFQLTAAAPPRKTHLINTIERSSTFSCYVGLRKKPWEFTLPRKNADITCEYVPAFESWLYCIHETMVEKGHSNKTFEKGFQEVRDFCAIPKIMNKTDAEFYEAFNNGTRHIKDQAIPDTNITYPVKVDPILRMGYYQAYYGYYYNRDVGNYFGGIICAYFVGVMVFAAILRFLRYTPLHKAIFKQKILNFTRGYLIVPTLGKKHASAFSYVRVITGYLPTRFETLVVLGYLIIHTVFMACNYHFDPYNIIFPTRRAQIARFVADRSGIISFAHFPLIVLFAGRNNFLELISGLQRTSFIVFHKWLGRMMFLDAVIHSAAYTNYFLFYKRLSAVSSRVYWKFGVAATCLSSMMIFFSLAVFRRHFYEVFLFLHIVLSALFFYTCWEHVVDISGIEWIYAAIAIWALDRLVRLVRVALIGFPAADLQLVGSDLIRITAKKPSNFWRAKPGQYVYVSFLHPLCFWQSHPFTVMDSCSKDGEVVIILKEKKGVTRLLRNHLVRKGGKASMKLAIEGPYGTSSPIHRFDRVLLLTGGTGIPGPIAHAIGLGKATATTGSNSIELVMAVKGFEVLEACRPEIMALKNLNIAFHIYNTSCISGETKEGSRIIKNEKQEMAIEKTPSPEETSQTVSIDTIESELDFAKFHIGRPNIESILKNSVNEPGSLAVVCCGPPALVDRVRNETAKIIIENSTSVIEYFEEYQAW